MSDEATPTKPVPVPDDASAGFWEAAARGVLAFPYCGRCDGVVFPPVGVCPNCGSTDPELRDRPVDGGGTVRSWTVVRDAFVPGFAEETPVVLVDVELEQAPSVRMIGRLIDGPDAPLRLGDRVNVVFEPVGEELSVPAFELMQR
jgi:uncharacterized OB-fold protein